MKINTEDNNYKKAQRFNCSVSVHSKYFHKTLEYFEHNIEKSNITKFRVEKTGEKTYFQFPNSGPDSDFVNGLSAINIPYELKMVTKEYGTNSQPQHPGKHDNYKINKLV